MTLYTLSLCELDKMGDVGINWGAVEATVPGSQIILTGFNKNFIRDTCTQMTQFP